MTPQHQQAVITYLQTSGIVYEEVFDELYDHLVCGIQQAQLSGMPFDVAFANARQELGQPVVLQQIQQHQKKTVERQHQRWIWNQLRKPSIMLSTSVVGAGLWWLLADAGNNRLQLLLGVVVAVLMASVVQHTVAVYDQYRSNRRGKALAPYSLTRRFALHNSLFLLASALLWVSVSSPNLHSTVSLAIIWAGFLATGLNCFLLGQLANRSYKLS